MTVIRSILLGLSIGLIVVSSNAHAEEWYAGGNLHRADIASWHRASERNQLATAADFIVKTMGVQRLKKIGMSGLKKHAQALVTCINTSTVENGRVIGIISRRTCIHHSSGVCSPA